MRYIAGTSLTFEIPLFDAEGNGVDATAITYSVVDGDGVELIAPAELTGYTAGSDASVTVPEAINTLDAGVFKAAREIVLECTTSSGFSIVRHSYILESSSGTLVRGVNTLVTIANADMLADDMNGLTGWKTSTRQEKTTALIEAYSRLGKLRFTYCGYDYAYAQNHLRMRSGSITLMSVSEVLSLDSKLLAALSQAQVAEADAILSGDEISSRRRDGIVLETIGEVKQMFKNSKPLELPISRKALSYVTQYVSLGSKVIGRG